MQRSNFLPFIPLLIAFSVLNSSSSGQTPARTPEQIKASYEAHKNDFDFLLGDWQITVHTARGIRHGYWSAVKLANGQILDEYRLVSDKGETELLLTTARNYNAVLDQWELVNMNGQNGLQETGTAHKVGDEIHLEQKVDQLRPGVIRRVRYHDITARHFMWNADATADGGKTWLPNVTQIDATRIGPARTIVLTSPSGSAATAAGK